MSKALVAVFATEGMVLGTATTHMPNMRARMEIVHATEHRIVTTLSVEGAGPACEMIVNSLLARYDCTVEDRQVGDGSWQGTIIYEEPEELRQHPACTFILQHLRDISDTVMEFRRGLCVMRVPLRRNAEKGLVGQPREGRTLLAWVAELEPGVNLFERFEGLLAPLTPTPPRPELDEIEVRAVV